MNRFITFTITSILLFLTGCRLTLVRSHDPPPGWSKPVYELLLTENSFPTGWEAGYDIPERVKDPSTNHVTMEWVRSDGKGLVTESIWRAITIEDAESKYKELRETRYQPSRTIAPDIKYIPFAPPNEITFQSKKADRFYIACGWLESAYCITLARYQNYVVALTTDLQGKIENNEQDKGLSYGEIETLLNDMDAVFVDFLNSLAK